MKVKKIQLRHVGRFSELDMPLAPTAEKSSNITIIVGNNGSGKTTLLQSLAIALSWLTARIKREKGNGVLLKEQDIQNHYPTASITIDVLGHKQDEKFQWSLAKTQLGLKPECTSQLNGVTALADQYRSLLSENDQSSLPIISFYSAARYLSFIHLQRIHTKDRNLQQIDGYNDSSRVFKRDEAVEASSNFYNFFAWFRDRAEIENASLALNAHALEILIQQLEKKIHKMPGNIRTLTGYIQKEDDANYLLESLTKHKETYDRQLEAVRNAIYAFMPGFENLRIQHKPDIHMSVDKEGQTLNIKQLSQGEKSLLALIGDIVRRLCVMNPGMDNPLEGDGIVLIDEVDLHLHPQWQRSLVERLQRTFPNCQFVLTTHSPLVISDSNDVLCYALDDGELSVMDDLFGLDANQVLLQVMDTDIRNSKIQEKLDTLSDAIQDQDMPTAKKILSELTKVLPQGHLELAKASLMLKRLELILAKNN